MKIGTMLITAGVVALGLAAWNTPSKAQGPLYDRVNVNLPYSVTIGERTLPPGDYVIQQLRDQGGNSRVLLIYSDNGMKFETSAMTIPALDQNTPEKTSVVLHHFGNDYYFDKVWIQGKDYGYEFPVPDSVKSREKERLQPVSVAANYSTVQQSDTTAANNQTTTSAANNQTTTSAATNRQTTTSAANNGQTTLGAAASSQTTTSAATNRQTTTAQQQPETTQTPATTTSTMTAQNQTSTAPTTTPSTMAPATSPATSRSTMSSTSSADRSMPNTSAGWLMMLLGGGALSGAGFSIRRKR